MAVFFYYLDYSSKLNEKNIKKLKSETSVGDRSVLIVLVGRTVDDNSGWIFRYMSEGTEILKIQRGGVGH